MVKKQVEHLQDIGTRPARLSLCHGLLADAGPRLCQRVPCNDNGDGTSTALWSSHLQVTSGDENKTATISGDFVADGLENLKKKHR
jgi:hypothetical protein